MHASKFLLVGSFGENSDLSPDVFLPLPDLVLLVRHHLGHDPPHVLQVLRHFLSGFV